MFLCQNLFRVKWKIEHKSYPLEMIFLIEFIWVYLFNYFVKTNKLVCLERLMFIFIKRTCLERVLFVSNKHAYLGRVISPNRYNIKRKLSLDIRQCGSNSNEQL